jgi:hypothetical protein
MSERDARDRAHDALRRACTDSLGLTTPPLPAPHTVAEKIAGLRRQPENRDRGGDPVVVI